MYQYKEEHKRLATLFLLNKQTPAPRTTGSFIRK